MTIETPFVQKRRTKAQLKKFIFEAAAVLVAFALVTFMGLALIHAIDSEARISERKRIAATLSRDAAKQAQFIVYMEKVGRSGHDRHGTGDNR